MMHRFLRGFGKHPVVGTCSPLEVCAWSQRRCFSSTTRKAVPGSTLAQSAWVAAVELANKHTTLEKTLSEDSMSLSIDEITKLSRELMQLQGAAKCVEIILDLTEELDDLEAMIAESDVGGAARDADTYGEAKMMRDECVAQLLKNEEEIVEHLIPVDEDHDRNAIVEVRAGTGGDEAALFASDLYQMYERYCKLAGFTFKSIAISKADSGGYKEASVMVTGEGA